MTEWKEYKLGEIADVQTGPFGSQLHMSDYQNEGTPIITVEHLGDNRIIHNNLPLVGDEDKNRLRKYVLSEGDIVFSRVGSVDRRAYVSAKEDGWMFSGRCLRVRPSQKADAKFLSYYFGLEDFKETIRRIAVGATMPSINTTILSNVVVPLPPIDTQRRISAILSSLDDKIDLLHRENATLEQMAETLFRQWFVVEAKKEWEDVLLGDLIDIGSGKGLQRSEFVENGLYSVLGANGEIGKTNKYLVDEGDRVIYTGRVGTLGNIFRLENKKAWLSDNTLVVRPKEYYYFIFFVLKCARLQDFNVGSTQPLIRQSDIKEVELSLPDENSLKAFEKACNDIYKKIDSNNNQIKTLIQTRDGLLPRLMSNELIV